MILICGTRIDIDTLPLNDCWDYQVENDEADIDFVLTGVLPKNDCELAFVADKYKGLVDKGLYEKVRFFSDDLQLMSLLEVLAPSKAKSNTGANDTEDSLLLIARLQDENDSLDAQNSKLSLQIGSLKSEYEGKLNDLKQQHEVELAGLDSQYKSQLEDVQGQLNEALDSLEEQKALVADLQEDTESSRGEVAGVSEKLAELQSEYEGLVQAKAELEERLQQVEDAKAEADSVLKVRTSELEALRGNSRADVEAVENRLKETEGVCASLQTEKAALELAHSELVQQLGQSKIDIGLLEQQVQAKEQELLDKEATFEQERKKLVEQEGSILALTSRTSEMQETINTLRGKVDELELAIVAKDNEIKSKDVQLAGSNEQVALELSKQKVQYEKEKLALTGELTATKIALDSLNHSYAELKSAYSDKEMSSSEGQAGVAAGLSDFLEYLNKPTKLMANGVLSEEQTYLNFPNKVVLVTSSGHMSAAYLTDVMSTWINAGLRACIVDFTGDIVLSGKHQLLNNTTLRSFDLLKGVEKGVTVRVKNAMLTPCLPFHDVAMLGHNWGKILKDLSMQIPEDMPIILLLGGIERFSTKYLVNKFSDRYSTLLFMAASAVNPTQTISELKLMSTARIQLVVTNVSEQLQPRVKPLKGQFPTAKMFAVGASIPVTVITDHFK